MPHPVRHQPPPPSTLLHQFVDIATALAPLPTAPSHVSSPLDDQGEAASLPESNRSEAPVPAPAHVSIVDGSVSDVARAVTPTDGVSALFAEPPPVLLKKRKRNQLKLDQDRSGKSHPLPETLASQPHRQRLMVTTNEHLRLQFLAHIAKSRD